MSIARKVNPRGGNIAVSWKAATAVFGLNLGRPVADRKKTELIRKLAINVVTGCYSSCSVSVEEVSGIASNVANTASPAHVNIRLVE